MSLATRCEAPVAQLRSGPRVSHHFINDSNPLRFMHLAGNVMAEHGLIVPDLQSLETVVSAALAAQYIFFSAVLYSPTQTELDAFVEDFVFRCVLGDQINTSAVHQRPSEARYQHSEVEL